MQNPTLNTERPVSPAESPVATQVWNDIVARKYAQSERVLVEAAAAHSHQVWPHLPKAKFVLDIGCGFGDTSAHLAKFCSKVVGVDCSELLVQLAQERHGHAKNLEFTLGDIGAYKPPQLADLVYSRFGLMFFERPVQTLRAIRAMMSDGAELHSLAWSSKKKNPWLELARDTVLQHLPPIDDGAPNCGPGPFSMADAETTVAVFEAAGFKGVELTQLQGRVSFCGAVEAAAFQLNMGPAGEIMRHASELAHPGVPDAQRAVLKMFEDLEHATGLELESSSWWIRARA